MRKSWAMLARRQHWVLRNLPEPGLRYFNQAIYEESLRKGKRNHFRKKTFSGELLRNLCRKYKSSSTAYPAGSRLRKKESGNVPGPRFPTRCSILIAHLPTELLLPSSVIFTGNRPDKLLENLHAFPTSLYPCRCRGRPFGLLRFPPDSSTRTLLSARGAKAERSNMSEAGFGYEPSWRSIRL